jgi:hypothetical protein
MGNQEFEGAESGLQRAWDINWTPRCEDVFGGCERERSQRPLLQGTSGGAAEGAGGRLELSVRRDRKSEPDSCLLLSCPLSKQVT